MGRESGVRTRIVFLQTSDTVTQRMANGYNKICSNVLPPFLHLPVELQTKILLRLPVTSLSTCKRVCKSFHTLIRNPEFKQNYSVLLLQFVRGISSKMDQTSHVLVSIDNTTKDVISCTSLIPQIPCVGMLFLIGSCNGLVCFAVRTESKYHDDILLLWNPVTEQSKYVPLPNIDGYSHEQTMEFYFVPETNDYNILSIGFIRGMPDDIHVAIYRVSTNSWEIADGIRLGHKFNCYEYYNNYRKRESSTSVFLNESFHWMFSSEDYSEIVSFNINDEELGWIRCIDHDESIPWGKYELGIIDESLALLYRRSDRKEIKIEVMNDYEVEDSWFLKYTLGPKDVVPRGCWKNSVMTSDQRSLCFYDTNEVKMTKKLIPLPANSSLSGFSSFLLP